MHVADLEALREAAPALNWKGGSDRVERLRMVKDEWELGQIREAIAIAERAFTAFRAMLRPDDTESDLANRMEALVRHCGGQATCFPTIVAVGERAALPHAPPTARRVGTSELLLVDWGVDGPLSYKSDLTRVLTAHIISSKLKEVYAVVLEAQVRAIRAVRPGVKAQSVDAEARAAIAEAGYGEFFGHGLGHGIGLQVHEGPAVRPLSETVLEAGMVFTVEPGVYLPGWGGVRIEDDVLVTSDGCEVLTRCRATWTARGRFEVPVRSDPTCRVNDHNDPINRVTTNGIPTEPRGFYSKWRSRWPTSRIIRPAPSTYTRSSSSSS